MLHTDATGEMPDDWTMALALTIVKNRPPTQSISAYISSLRLRFCKHSAPRRLVILNFRPISYFKFMLQQKEDEVLQIASKLEHVTKENVDLRQQLRVRPRENRVPCKRKGADLDDSNQTLLDSALEVPGIMSIYRTYTQSQDVGQRQVSDSMVQLLQFLHSLRTAELRSDAFKSGKADDGFLRASSLISSMLGHFTHPKATNSPFAFASAVDLIDRVIALLFQRLAARNASRRAVNADASLIYACANLFNSLYKLLEEVGRRNAEQPRPMRRSKRRKTEPAQSAVEHFIDPTPLTDLLCGMMTALDEDDERHQQLCEAFAYVVLNNAGSQLYAAVFDTAQPKSLEEGLCTHANINNHEGKSMKGLWPHSVQLVQCVMDRAVSFLEPSLKTKSKARHDSKTKSSPVPKHALACAARDRLQRTLVRGFDGNDSSEQDGSLGIMSMPRLARLKGRPIQAAPPNAREWFVGEVWRILGWDILRQDDC